MAIALSKAFKKAHKLLINISMRILSLVFTIALMASLALASPKNEVTLYFDNGHIKRISIYENQVLVERKHFDNRGRFTVHYLYEHTPQSVIRTSVDPQDTGKILTKEEWSSLTPDYDTTPESVRLKAWIYKDNQLLSLEYFDTLRRVQKKDLFKNSQKTSTIFYYYKDSSKDAQAFHELDPKGRTLSQYRLYEPYTRSWHLSRQLNPEQVKRVLETHRTSKLKIAVIDSGFDYNHVNLAHKFYQNPLESSNGQDDDNNGWVDDLIGWDQKADSNLPSEITTALQKELRPLSHGTHVADIATSTLNNVHLIGFGGDYTQAAYVDKISDFIKAHQIQVVNMSIGIPPDPKNDMGLRDAAKAYERMMRANPDTLFVVAAGNSGLNIDEFKNRQFPASFKFTNLITVGSADTSSLRLPSAPPAISSFSNWGESVDIYSPGRNIKAASLGGGLIEHSGTSMASPFVARIALEILNVDPTLKPEEIKSLLLKGVSSLEHSERLQNQGLLNREKTLFLTRLQKIQKTRLGKHGPNCWNASLFLAGVNNGLYYTDDTAFRSVIDSPLCQEIPQESLQAGDIIALRRYASGKLLPASFLSEVHAFTYLDSQTVLTKDGPHKEALYNVSTLENVRASYARQESKNCKIYGLDKSQCQLQTKFYRCQPLADKAASLYEKSLIERLQQLESQTENVYTKNTQIPKAEIEDLKNHIQISSVPAWLKSHFETTLATMLNIL